MATLLQLADQHRAAQDQLRRALALRTLATWRRMMSVEGRVQLADAWLAAMLPLILSYRTRSEALARLQYGRARELGAPGAEPMPNADADELAEEALVASLVATGLAGLRDRLDNDVAPALAFERAGTEVVGAAARHALNGGRSYMKNAIAVDTVTVGWYRVTRDGCCSFCAVLASRGAVYKEDSFDESDPRFMGDGEEKVHDHCACTLAPIYRREDGVPDRNQEFSALWETSTRGYSGQDALNAFRRAYEAANRDRAQDALR